MQEIPFLLVSQFTVSDPLPASRPGKACLILRSDLDEWLKRQKPEKS